MAKATVNAPGNPLTQAPQVNRPSDHVNAKEIRAKHKEYLFPSVTNYYAEPVVLAEGKGTRALPPRPIKLRLSISPGVPARSADCAWN